VVTGRSCVLLITLLLGGAPSALAQSVVPSALAQIPETLAPRPLSQSLPDLDQLIVFQSWWHVGDMITTAYDLRHGGREANPLLSPLTHHPVQLSIVSGAIDVLQAYAIRKLARRHPRLAHLWAGALLVTEIWTTTNNVRVAGELQRRGGR
jgi:hypothetical protein